MKPFTSTAASRYKHLSGGEAMFNVRHNRLSGVAQSTIGDTVVVVWQGHLSAEGWAWHIAELQRAISRHPDHGAMVVSIVLPTSNGPAPALLAKMADDFRKNGPKLRRFIVAPLGDSLWLHFVRTSVRTVFLLAGLSGRYSVADTIEEALSCTVDVATDHSPSARTIRACLDKLFDTLGEPPK